jgi:hypothetical protein
MRYLWNVPAELDNSRLRAVIGAEPHTPLDEAVTTSLSELNPRERVRAQAEEHQGHGGEHAEVQR